MARTRCAQTPTNEEILSYDNVPVPVAAAYLGCGTGSLRSALQQGRAPFGYASIAGEDGSKWMPHISPGQLVAYKNGTLPAVDDGKIVSLLTEAVERTLEQRSKAALKAIAKGLLDIISQT